MDINCKICRSRNWGVLYKGPIRMGKFGDWSDRDYTVYKCDSCKVGYLPMQSLNYESNEYRKIVDGSTTTKAYWKLHDKEQAEKLSILGTENLRGKIIADIGCGAGSFLDLISGMTSKTIAVEPFLRYQSELSKHHRVYQYCKDALQDYSGHVDLAVSFAVLEHVQNPLEFLKEIRRLLIPGGCLLLSTPNYDDWLIKFLSGIYDLFFFRKAHVWYFNGDSLKTIAKLAGFKRIKLQYKHRFDFSNALHWIRDKRPTGLGKTSLFSAMDGLFKKHLEDIGKSDFIYAWLWN